MSRQRVGRRPAASFSGPASGRTGPLDNADLFDRFLDLVREGTG